MLKTERVQLLSRMGLQENQLILGNVDHSVLRYQKEELDYSLTFGGYEVIEGIFTFDSKGYLKELNLSMYNRGDCGLWRAKKYQSLVNGMKRVAGKVSKDKKPRNYQQRLKDKAIFESIWSSGDVDLVLRWCSGRNVQEYVTVLFVPHKSSKKQTKNMGMQISLDMEDLAKQVHHGKGGACWLEVPMVDQGDKGYCVAATIARILKYYKADVDQHVLAQIFGSDAEKGTQVQQMIESMQKCRDRFNVDIRELYSDRTTENSKHLMTYVTRYNQLAKKAGKPSVNVKQIRYSSDYPLNVMGKIMDPKLFVECRCYRGKLLFSMMPIVKRYINKGIPLCWVVPSHARLIVGYRGDNAILYSDSWGAGHEVNEMSLKEAVALTGAIYLITPR